MQEHYKTVLARPESHPVEATASNALRTWIDKALVLLLLVAKEWERLSHAGRASRYRTFVGEVLMLTYNNDREQVAQWFERHTL